MFNYNQSYFHQKLSLKLSGELPSQRYPLVCPASIPYNKNASFMNQMDFGRLKSICQPMGAEPDPAKERLQRLKEKSQMLQMGWPDNNKDVVKRLAEKFLTTTNEYKDLKEMEEREVIAKAKPKPRQGYPKSLTGRSTVRGVFGFDRTDRQARPHRLTDDGRTVRKPATPQDKWWHYGSHIIYIPRH